MKKRKKLFKIVIITYFKRRLILNWDDILLIMNIDQYIKANQHVIKFQ